MDGNGGTLLKGERLDGEEGNEASGSIPGEIS